MSVPIDHQLIFEARRLRTGADVHRVKEMIFAYEQAVDLHNHDWPSHRKYQPEHEARLRCYVIRRRIEELEQRITAVLQHASELRTSSTTPTRTKRGIPLFERRKLRGSA